jgi:hypothetical protein
MTRMWLREIVDAFGDLVDIDAKRLARSDEALGELALILWRSGQSFHSIGNSVPGNAGRFGRLERLRRITLARESNDSGYRTKIEHLSAELAKRVEEPGRLPIGRRLSASDAIRS